VPRKPQHPCSHLGCPNIVPIGEQYCEAHRPLHKQDYPRKNPEINKVYGTVRWKKYRKWFLLHHPICIKCGRSATVVNHIKDHHGDYNLIWDITNHEPMCKQCHDKHTAKTKGWGKRGQRQ